MSTSSLSRDLSMGIVILGLLCGVGLWSSAASADAVSADDLCALVSRDGWVLVRVGLAPAPAPAGFGASGFESQAQADAIEDLLFALPDGSFADVEHGADGSSLVMHVDAAGLDGLLASEAVARVAPAAMPVAMRRVAGGYQYSLAVKLDGSLWAWGNNYSGQIGDGSATDRRSPVYVMSGVAGVAAGYSHSLAVKTDGTLWAWGANQDGQIGDGSTTVRRVPVQVMTGAIAIAGGGLHSFALKSNGTLWAWGDNGSGQLGDGTRINRSRPVYVMSGVAGVAAGYSHSLAVKTDGSLWAWGANQDGQIGDGSATDRRSPVYVMSGVAGVAAGYSHSLAVKTDGSLWAWGFNESGRLGDGTTNNRSRPVYVTSGVAGVAARDCHSLAVKTDGSLWAWGCNGTGQLGNGSTTDRSTTPVPVMNGVAGVAAGGDHSLALKTDGSLWAWGCNLSGQVGDGTQPTVRRLPVPVLGFPPLVPPAPAAPTNLTAQAVSGTQINLAWRDNSRNELGFRVLRTIGTSSLWLQVGQVGRNVTQFSNLPLTRNTTYRYRVLAYNLGGSSAYSNEVTATTPALATKPAAPTVLVARAVSRTQIDLTWRDNASNEQGFRIERQIGTGRWMQIAEVAANSTSYASLGLTPNTAYRYRVRAFNTAGTSAYATSTVVRTPR